MVITEQQFKSLRGLTHIKAANNELLVLLWIWELLIKKLIYFYKKSMKIFYKKLNLQKNSINNLQKKIFSKAFYEMKIYQKVL